MVKKKSPQKQSMNKLKENYADELAELVRIIPQLQKQLADIQMHLIDELCDLLDNDIQIGKVELDLRIGKAQELRRFLENESSCSLPSKSAFIKHASAVQKNQPVKEVKVSQ